MLLFLDFYFFVTGQLYYLYYYYYYYYHYLKYM